MRVNKDLIVRQIQEDHPELTLEQINAVYQSVFKTIMERVADGDQVMVLGFGRFEARDLKERNARNVVTGDEIKVPAQRRPRFKAGATFNQLVSGK